ncbi:unnamed protein product [Alternaria alternata]
MLDTVQSSEHHQDDEFLPGSPLLGAQIVETPQSLMPEQAESRPVQQREVAKRLKTKRDYQCAHCDKIFTKKYNWESHLRTHGDNLLNGEIDPNRSYIAQQAIEAVPKAAEEQQQLHQERNIRHSKYSSDDVLEHSSVSLPSTPLSSRPVSSRQPIIIQSSPPINQQSSTALAPPADASVVTSHDEGLPHRGLSRNIADQGDVPHVGSLPQLALKDKIQDISKASTKKISRRPTLPSSSQGPRRIKYDPNAPAPVPRRHNVRPEIHLSQSARDVNRPSQEDTRSMRSDPTPSRYYPDQRQSYYSHAGPVIQPATTRPRRHSASRPVSYSGDIGPQYHWTQGAPGGYYDPRASTNMNRRSGSGYSSYVPPRPSSPKSDVAVYGEGDTKSMSTHGQAGDSGKNEIRLRVDANAPLSLQFNGDMEGRTLRLIPGEDGMAELVISGKDADLYKAEQERRRQNRRPTVYQPPRPVLDDGSEGDSEDIEVAEAQTPSRRRSADKDSREHRDHVVHKAKQDETTSIEYANPQRGTIVSLEDPIPRASKRVSKKQSVLDSGEEGEKTHIEDYEDEMQPRTQALYNSPGFRPVQGGRPSSGNYSARHEAARSDPSYYNPRHSPYRAAVIEPATTRRLGGPSVTRPMSYSGEPEPQYHRHEQPKSGRRQEESERQIAEDAAKVEQENKRHVRFELGLRDSRAKERAEKQLAEREKDRAAAREESRRLRDEERRLKERERLRQEQKDLEKAARDQKEERSKAPTVVFRGGERRYENPTYHEPRPTLSEERQDTSQDSQTAPLPDYIEPLGSRARLDAFNEQVHSSWTLKTPTRTAALSSQHCGSYNHSIFSDPEATIGSLRPPFSIGDLQHTLQHIKQKRIPSPTRETTENVKQTRPSDIEPDSPVLTSSVSKDFRNIQKTNDSELKVKEEDIKQTLSAGGEEVLQKSRKVQMDAVVGHFGNNEPLAMDVEEYTDADPKHRGPVADLKRSTSTLALDDSATDVHMDDTVRSGREPVLPILEYDPVNVWLGTRSINISESYHGWGYESTPSGSSSYAASVASVFSVASLASSASDISKGSGYSAEEIATATKVLLSVFYEDKTLLWLYKSAIGNEDIGPERLQRNLKRLFRAYAGLLESEATERLEHLSSRLVLVKSTFLAQSIVEKLQNGRVSAQSPRSERDEESSDEEDDDTDTQLVNEEAFEDLAIFREFLVESDAFRTFRDQLEAFVLPKSAYLTHGEPASEREASNTTTIKSIPTKAIAGYENVLTWQKWRRDAKLSTDGLFHGACFETTATGLLHLVMDAIFLVTDDLLVAAGRLEPPLSPNMVRLRWQCTCGDSLHSDVSELRKGGIEELISHMQRTSGARVLASPHSQQSGNQKYVMPNPTQWIQKAFTSIFGGSAKKSAACLPQHNTSCTSTTTANALPPQRSILHLLACMHRNRLRKDLKQDRIEDITTDRALLCFLRKQYRLHRGRFLHALSLQSVKGISFVKFRLPIGGSVDVRHHDPCCVADTTGPKTCECIPPPPKVEPSPGAEYRCIPGPPATYPPIPPVYLASLFTCPTDVHEKDTWILDQLPKRTCGELKGQIGQPAEGWGIYYDEGLDGDMLAWTILIVFLVASLLFGVLWSKFQYDIQGAFGVSAYMVACCAAVLPVIVTKLGNKG